MKDYFLNESDVKHITNHYKKFFTLAGAKDSERVLHERESDGMHIDLVRFDSTEKFPYYIFATIGMSGYEMPYSPKNIELIMFLPKTWQVDAVSLSKEEWYWPFRILSIAARLPYYDNSYLGSGHTLSLNENNTPVDHSTEMCFGLITFPTMLAPGIFELEYGESANRKKVTFFCLTAINKREFKTLQKIGLDEFIDSTFVNKDGVYDLSIRTHRNNE